MKTSNEHTKQQKARPFTPEGEGKTARGTARFADARNTPVAQRKLRKEMADRPGSQASVQLRQRMENGAGAQTSALPGKRNATGLPDQLKSGIESLSGHAMDDVKVHYNSSKPAQLQAHAYAQGTEIHLAPGQEKHLPHEAWHVVQQKQGRVQPTRQLKSKVNINDDAGLEREADEMGEKAMRRQQAGTAQLQKVAPVGVPVVQAVQKPWMMSGNKNNELDEVENEPYVWDGYEMQRHQTAIPYARIYLPEGGPTKKATYTAHGDHTGYKGKDNATFEAPAGVSLSYVAPHGYDANSGVVPIWVGIENDNEKGRDAFYRFSPGPTKRGRETRAWYDYKLTQERFQANMAPAVAQNVADKQKVTVILIDEEVQTSQLIQDLAGLGYTDITAVHCRGAHDNDSREWMPVNYDTLSLPGKGLRYLKDTYANVKGDPGPRPTGNTKKHNQKIPSENLIDNENFSDPITLEGVTRTNLGVGLMFQDEQQGCYFRVVAVIRGMVYLRGITQNEFNLLTMEADEMEDMKTKARANASGAYQKALDFKDRYVSGLAAYKDYDLTKLPKDDEETEV